MIVAGQTRMTSSPSTRASSQRGFKRDERWYDCGLESVLLWDFSVQTHHEIGARRPGLVIIDKKKKKCQLIDVAIPEHGRVRGKKDEKV